MQGAAVNIKGQSVDDLINDFERQEALNISNINLNQTFIARNIASDKEGVRLGLESRIIGSLPNYVRPPNTLGFIFGTAASALGAFAGAGGFDKAPDAAATVSAKPVYGNVPLYET